MEQAAYTNASTVNTWSKRLMWSGRLIAVFGSPFAGHFFYNLPLFCPWARYPQIASLVIAVPMTILWLILSAHVLCMLVASAVRRDFSRMAQALELGCIATAMILIYLSPINFRELGYRSIANHGDRIVRALERYKIDHGTYPDRLQQLSPRYLDNPDSTGSGAYPKFIYSLGDNKDFDLRVNTEWFATIQYSREDLTKRTEDVGERLRANWYFYEE